MVHGTLQPEMAWAEDRALLRSNPSADPGAKTGAGAGNHLAPLPFCQLRDWHEREKPSRQDAAIPPTGCPSKLANAERQEFQFPLNQDRAKVYGKGCHHDAVRSSHSHTVWRWGHRWVVLAVAVKFPWAKRPWALPVLVALYRPRALNEQEGRRHKTPIELARGLMAVLMRWFPDRKFVFLGDGGYASHEFARFFHRHRRRAALVSRFLGTAALYDPPPKYRGKGRPRVKGRKRKSPEEVVADGHLKKIVVDWYSGTKREVRVRDGQGLWYKSGRGLVPVRWVFVRDETGHRRDEYFYTTNPEFDPATIIHYFTCRWSMETTFQEMRAHLGFETTRGRVANTILRAGPCLLGLFTVVSLIYHKHLKRRQPRLSHRPGYEKAEPTFTDAIAEVRRLFWTETIFAQPYLAKAIQKFPPKLKNLLLDNLCQAL